MSGPLTQNQALVLESLTSICRRNAVLYRESCQHLHKVDLDRLARGDRASVFGMGGLTFQVGKKAGMPPANVLRIFKALESKGMVIREEGGSYQRPLYWWPVGLAEQLSAEMAQQPTNGADKAGVSS